MLRHLHDVRHGDGVADVRLSSIAAHLAAATTVSTRPSGSERDAMRSKCVAFRALHTDEDANAVLDLATRFGAYHLHSEGATLSIGFGAGESVPRTSRQPPFKHMVANEDGSGWIFPHRYDSALNSDAQLEMHGDIYGRSPNNVPPHSNYFRETYSFGGRDGLTHYHPSAAGVCERFKKAAGSAACSLFPGRRLADISVLYGNLLLPGMEILLHADVPEFRGLSRKQCPSWLLVVMHHSDLFETHRIHSATCVSYYTPLTKAGVRAVAKGGELRIFSSGPERAARRYQPAHNSAVLLDTDSCFHSVSTTAQQLNTEARHWGQTLWGCYTYDSCR